MKPFCRMNYLTVQKKRAKKRGKVGFVKTFSREKKDETRRDVTSGGRRKQRLDLEASDTIQTHR